MAFDGSSLDNYIDVAERIQAFYKKYPEGSLTQISMEFVQVANRDWVVYTAAAFRSPDDEHPGIGTSWEPIPGTTPYTKGSEVQNAETAAWGRAIVAVGLASSAKIASRQEVEAREAERAAANRVRAIKNEIAKRMPGVAPDEIRRRINEALGLPEDFGGEYSADELESFLNRLPGPTGQQQVARALGQSLDKAREDVEEPAEANPQATQEVV